MKNFASQLPREKYWPTLEFQIEDTGSKKNLTRLKKIYQSTLCLSLTAVTLAQKLKPFSNRVFYWGRESIEFVF